MRIAITSPAPPGTRLGNRVTAQRWARLLRELGHRVRIVGQWDGEPADVLVALHALKSAPSVERWRDARGQAPLVVALTGTDVYGDIHTSRRARAALDAATRIVALQPLALDELPPAARARARVIVQSAVRPPGAPGPSARSRWFDVLVLGHLRAVKDPLRAAHAARSLPASSRLRVVHLGAALDEGEARRARAEMARNPRYVWLGDAPRWRALRRLAASRALVLSSRSEGGANAVCEAIACGVPVITSAIPGALGLLGVDWPATFPVGDTARLAALLMRAEQDPAWLAGLSRRCKRLASNVLPSRERARWRQLLTGLRVGSAGPGE